jgi:hypothetical protein
MRVLKKALLSLVLLAAGILLTVVLGCRSSGPERETPGDTVRALRYKRLCFESMLEFTHADGTWYEDLYFPENGVRATLLWTSSWDEEAEELEFKDQPKLHATYGEILNKSLLGPLEEKETQQPTEEVQVPRDLAERIFALADLQRRVDEETPLLGEEVYRRGVLRMNVGPPAGQE